VRAGVYGLALFPFLSLLFILFYGIFILFGLTALLFVIQLAKMYEQYQDAADALRHERWGRRHAEAVLERVLFNHFLKIFVLYLDCAL
jgi:hypothetical protein